jgi:thiol-disulfide isomerase/thioredoxin
MNVRRTETMMNLATSELGRQRTQRRSVYWLVLFIAIFQQGHVNALPDASGIAWYSGDVDHAFELARSNHKLVLLYWGATWCPPCQQLRSFVFTRKDFIEKSRQFVAVHLDGDDPGAQKWGERFHVSGYPTVVILRSDQVEVTRLTGGADLSLYAELLDTALSDVKPIKDVLDTLHDKPIALSAGDCRRLAYYPWDVRNFLVSDPKAVAADLRSAAHKCDGLNAPERGRLIIESAALATTPATTRQVIALVHDNALAPHLVDVLEQLQDAFFASVHSQGASITAQFEADWVRTMDQVSNDPAVIDAEQLAAVGTKLDLVKQFAVDKKVPGDLATAARARVMAALAKHVDPYIRSGIVNSADFVYDVIDDKEALYRMLQAEVTTAKAPYYYMEDLGDLEEKRGHAAEALSWYERAYRDSTGTATRFQWGCGYLSALLRLAPKEHERIRRVGIEVLAELNGPDRIHARAREELGRLDASLRKWNATHLYDADIAALRVQMHGVCAKLPADDSGRSSCMRFLG